eukprot:gene463-1106_t
MKVVLMLALTATVLLIQQDLTQARMHKYDKRGLSLFIYKGTKYCGKGDIAKSYDDLGKHRLTDMCCRAHDLKCPVRISSFGKKYGTRNYSWKVKSDCKCEKRFMDCLLKANTIASLGLYQIYFNMIKPDCIRLKTVKTRVCKKRSWFRCVKHGYKYTKKAYFYNLHKVLGI